MLARFGACACLVLVLAAIFLNCLPDVLGDLFQHLGAFKDLRADALVVVTCLGVSVAYGSMPLPGANLFKLFIGFMYQWWGFCFLLPGHVFGGLIAFGLGRLLWRGWQASAAAGGPSARCRGTGGACCCCRGRKGQPSKGVLLLMGSLVAVEEHPFRTILLLGLSPMPVTVLAHVLGARADSLSWRRFVLPFACSGVKLMQPIYLGSNAEDLGMLMSGEASPLDAVLTAVSVLFGLLTGCFISWYAMQKLRQAQENLTTIAELPGEGGGSRRSSGLETTVSLPMGKLCGQLFDEYYDSAHTAAQLP